MLAIWSGLLIECDLGVAKCGHKIEDDEAYTFAMAIPVTNDGLPNIGLLGNQHE